MVPSALSTSARMARRVECQHAATVRQAAVASPVIHVPVANESDRKLNVVESMDSWVAETIEPMLVPSSRAWQPTDLLPDASKPDFLDAVHELRQRCEDLPAALWLVLVGDMVTEEALPSYMSMLNRMEGTSDESGGDAHAWARWTRAWTSEENRHGDLLNKLLFLSGQVDMCTVERSIQHLIGTGFDPLLGSDPYRCFVYTSFQERATKISHHNTGRLAVEHGATDLAAACSVIAGDEARHEAAYQRIVDELLHRDPDGAVCAFAAMMEASIVMPAHLMTDGSCDSSAELRGRSGQPQETQFFQDFAAVADSLGVYTAADYASIVTHLMRRWRIDSLSLSNGEAAAAQEYLVQHEQRILRMVGIHEERKARRRKRGQVRAFQCAWMPEREVVV